jgi:NADP-dependent 3-hydroxy acid dehydrogenase YdfG
MNSADYNSLQEKRALVTGGTTGIGRAIAAALAQAGARVLIFGRHEPELKDALHDISEKGEVHGLTADAAREDDLVRVFEVVDAKLGGLDILINNAGLSGDDLLKSDFASWNYVLDTNVLAYVACARYATERMRKEGGGHIVNIGSISAENRSAGGEVYVASKSAVRGFSQSLAKTLEKDKIRVTLIEPGSVGSDMQEESPAEQRKSIAKSEMLKAEDIAECVIYCLTRPERCAVRFVQIGEQLTGEG